MKLTQFTLHKLHSNVSLPGTTNTAYIGDQSQPQVEVTAHMDVRRRFRRPSVVSTILYVPPACPALAALATTVILLSGAGSLGCRHRATAPPAPPRTAVQVLIQAGPQINPGDDGAPWPTAVTLYQLRADPAELAPFDGAAVLARGDAAFGELMIERRDYTAFPGTHTRMVVPLGPGATHLVAVAHFRAPLGDAAVLVYPVPPTAAADPCFYLGLERSELDGGQFPPPGFDPAQFATTCPPPADPGAAAAKAPGPVPKASPRAAPAARASSSRAPFTARSHA